MTTTATTPVIEHGKVSGWVAGCRKDCCRSAIYAYNRKWNSDIAIGGEEAKRLVDATGTKRRIQALMVMGWLAGEIATACGWSSEQAVTNLLTRDKVNRATDERVRFVYRKLWKCWLNGDLRHLVGEDVGTCRRARSIAQAEAKGFVPGGAWDDIDDPHEVPRGLGLETAAREAEGTRRGARRGGEAI
jgi:hypothetical protein